MLDYAEYTIDDNDYQGNGHNGYGHLDGEWLAYYKVGKRFAGKVKLEDKEDFLHDLFLAFARVKTSYDAKGKELTTGWCSPWATRFSYHGARNKDTDWSRSL